MQISKQKIIEASRNFRNFQAMKKIEDRNAIIEYGFSNQGELRSIKREKVVPFSAGLYNMLRQVLP